MYIDDMITSVTMLSHTPTCLKVCCWVHQLITFKCCGEAVDDSAGITETLCSFYSGAALCLYFGFFCSKHFNFFYDFTIPKLQEDRFFCISLNLHVPGNTVLKFLNQIRKWPNKFKINFIMTYWGSSSALSFSNFSMRTSGVWLALGPRKDCGSTLLT